MKLDLRQYVGRLLSRGVILEARDGQLHFQSAPGALTVRDRETLQQHKAEIVDLLDGGKVAVASFAQQRIWFLTSLAPGEPVYNSSILLELDGYCHLAPLLRALDEIWHRHESLRTRLEVWGDGPVQVIDRRAVPPGSIDLSGLPAAVARREADRAMLAVGRRPFDLARDPLARAVVFRLSFGQHRVILSFHHSIADGWSINILARELGQVYGALVEGRSSPLDAVHSPYAQFALRERTLYEQGEFEESLRFWSYRLGACQHHLDLPTDRPPRSQPSRSGAQVSLELPERLTTALRQLARKQSSSPFLVLLALYQAMLWRVSGQDEFNVGTPIANRDRPEVEGLVGLLVNTVVVPADCSGYPSLRDMVRRVRAAVIAAMDHEEVPFDLVVERLGAERGGGRQPLFSVLFNLRPLAAVDSSWEPLGAKVSVLFNGSSKLDLLLNLQDQGSVVSGVFELATDRFDRATGMRFGSVFLALAEAGLDDPDLPLSEVSLLTKAQRHQSQVEWNHPRRAPTGTVVDRLLAQVRERPDAIAVAARNGCVTYGGLERRSALWAGALTTWGVGRGSLVAILFPRSVAGIEAELGALRIGAAYLPFEPDVPLRRLEALLDDSGARCLLTVRRLADRVPASWRERCLVLDESTSAAAAPTDAAPARDDLAYVIYTSGSSGKAKPVAVSHAGLLGLADWHCQRYDLGPEDRTTLLASPAFDASVWETWPHLTAGARVEVVEDEVLASPPRLARWFGERGITLTFVPTPLLELLLDVMEPGEPAPRVLCTGGDRLRRRPPRGLAAEVHNHYGPTEVAVVATAGRVAPEASGLPSLGRPITGVRAFVADRGLRPVAIGAEGELCLAGSGVAWGYLGFAGLTAGQFVPDPWSGARGGRIYRTGDRVRWAPGGRLHFLGRLDQQVQIRGFRVEPGEIEAILQSHPAVLQATVVIDEGSQRPLAYAALSEPEAVSERELLEFLALRLPDPLMPSHVVCLDTIPLTTRGKVDRSRLPAPERNGESASGVAPRTPKERVLAIIWSRILGAGEIGAFDDFFALGGTSLQMMQVISRVRETFDVELSPSAFYDTPTLAAIAEVIRLGQRAPLLDAGLSISAGAVPSSPCVLLREGREEGSPMVCVHSGGGHLVEYLELASEMSKLGHPVYGLQARGLTADRSSPTDRIEAMASDYVDALRAVRPAGPYRFLGYCVGAVIAFEMAQRLRAEGEDVDFLGMVEPPQAPLGATAKDGAGPIPLAVVAAFAAELKVQTSADELREIVEGEARYPEALWTIFGRQAGERARALDRDTFDRLLAVYAAVARAKSRYTASSYGGPIILFEVDMHRTTPTAVPSWCQVTAGPIGHEIIRGNHLTCLRAPYVRDFGERLHQRFLALDASAVQRGAP